MSFGHAGGQLGSIQESGQSDTPTSSPESPPFQYDFDGQQNSARDGEGESDDDEFVYPGSSTDHTTESIPVARTVSNTQSEPSPAQLEALYASASSGDLPLLQRLFQSALETGDVQPFNLANHASTRTGSTALHAAASRGYLDIVQWLVEHCGAMPDLEDKEGETALHKAALNGHLSIVSYLLPSKADVHARDADGWTALHNACSKGYLDIVRWLCEDGGASSEVDGARGIDVRSKGGWTPLMNAASKGHLPVVLYLLNKQSANPLIRNNWGESAYDIAGAVFEIWICEVLQRAELDRWRNTTVPYNPLLVHVTVPIVIYENQRLDARLKTLAVSGGRPKFSASGLGKQGRHAPFELRLLKADETGATTVPSWRSDVKLPSREDPWTLPKGGHQDRSANDGSERSHFWLSDWTLDITHPGVDAEEGWQYAHHFNDPDEQWTAEKPAPLERLLTGSASGPSTPAPNRAGSGSRTPQTWVRRRRWVRVMRRRLDIPPLPFLEPDGLMYDLSAEGTLVPHVSHSSNDFGDDGDGQELSALPASFLSHSRDYVARARYLVGSQLPDPDPSLASAVEIRRAIATLERATTELRQGVLNDTDDERKTQAEVLLHALNRDLERRRLAAGANGLLISHEDDDHDGRDDDGSSDEEEFHYPGVSPLDTLRSPSRSSNSTDYFNQPGVSRMSTDLTPQLSQAPDFRVPTHETPQKVLVPRWTAPTPHQVHAQWERDADVNECRACQRRFNFLNRRHCRRCGRIFCDRCSSFRALLDPSDIVHDPMLPDLVSSSSSQRVCQNCNDVVSASVPGGLHASRTSTIERIVVEQTMLAIPSHMSRNDSSSQISDLADCPVCGQNLADLGNPSDQEAHVKFCLEGGSGAAAHPARYLVYRLPAESVLIGVECVICLEEFLKGSEIARLSCLCSFHNACLSSWLQRGRNCPVHAR
ncbi:hypothetical protein PC9H_005136 [Pleurotus ostreatus]|uniref:Uncharacterized protein n=1 Tax=Pleurotus ostreatus TaxID=5322 RepID=A0A8H7A3A2_PLEOS|nr:uncharacterized protein PC9H_005136 [Pleurotus ostreatus]KAF7433187.1 hypothetical protein PC9H_005136 [Pleurotus ostreatus]